MADLSPADALLLTHILDLVPDAIITVNSDQRIVHFNAGAVHIFGYRPDEVLGQPLDVLLPERFVSAHREHMRAFAEGPEQARPHPVGPQRRVTGRRKGGEEFPVEASIVTSLQDGRATFTVILRDVSERLRAEAALRQVEARYHLLVESVQDYALLMLDPQGRIVSWNTGAEHIMGYQAGEIIGQHISKLFLDEDMRHHTPERELRAAAEAGHCQVEGWRVRKDGSHFWASVVVAAVYDPDGQLHGFTKVTRDMTERKRAEEALRTAHERLQALSHRLIDIQEAERRAIAGELHDEIGQALTLVKMQLQSLRALPPGAPLTPALDESLAIVERTLQQVRDLSLDLRPSLLDDLGLGAALRWYLARQVRGTGCKVQFAADPLPERLPLALETVCFRVAQEALTNAARHAQARHISVELRLRQGDVHLTVDDDGTGFDVDRALARATQGASLGLLGMQERAMIAGGTLQITSASGEGTTIYACFPAAGPAATPHIQEVRE